MYAHFNGDFRYLSPTMAVVECGGVGYELHISLYTFERIKDLKQGNLFAHLAVKEDGHTLYGFFDELERNLFRHLISVQGVGAATARMMLSTLPPTELTQAIVNGNVGLIKSVKGVGPKSAQRIILELQDKLQKGDKLGVLTVGMAGNNANREEALAALQMLGFSKLQIEKVIDKIMMEDSNLKVEDIIKLTLKRL